MTRKDCVELLTEVLDGSTALHGERVGVQTEASEGPGPIDTQRHTRDFQVEIPVCRVPEVPIETAHLERERATNGHRWRRNEVLNEQSLQQELGRNELGIARQWAAPSVETPIVLVDEV